MISLLAILFSLLLLIKTIAFLIFPNQMLNFSNKIYQFITDYALGVQIGIMLLAVIFGALLSMLVGFLPMIAAGWFWGMVYSLFFMPIILSSIKNGSLKDLLFSSDAKNLLLAACVFIICLSILTIGLIL